MVRRTLQQSSYSPSPRSVPVDDPWSDDNHAQQTPRAEGCSAQGSGAKAQASQYDDYDSSPDEWSISSQGEENCEEDYKEEEHVEEQYNNESVYEYNDYAWRTMQYRAFPLIFDIFKHLDAYEHLANLPGANLSVLISPTSHQKHLSGSRYAGTHSSYPSSAAAATASFPPPGPRAPG